LAAIVESADDAIIGKTLDGIITSWNQGAQRLYGYTALEAVGQSIGIIVPRDCAGEIPEILERLRRGERIDHYETCRRHKDGSIVEVSLTILPIANRKGTLIGASAIARDITERRRAEEALRAEAAVSNALGRVGEELITALGSPGVHDRLCQVSTDVLQCECSFTLLRSPHEGVSVPVAAFGLSSEQWETLRVLRVPDQALAGLTDQLRRNEVVQVDLADPATPWAALPARFGLTRVLYVALKRGRDIIGVHAAAYRERTTPFSHQQERIARGTAHLASLALEGARLIEDLERANRVKSDFLATMSHELRTPLNIIMGYTDLLRDEAYGPLTSEQSDTLQRVHLSAHHLLALVNATLDVGRLAADNVRLDVSEIDVPALVQEVMDEMRRPDHLHRPVVCTPGAHLPPLHSDRGKVKIILKNLLDNAEKFAADGRTTVECVMRGERIEISVSDSGIGIAPEVLKIMFEPFRQGESSTTRNYGGVGLGLYVVQRLLDLLGGTIAVETEVGRGSTFRVSLPQQTRRPTRVS